MLLAHDNSICILDSWVEEKKGRRRGMGCVLKNLPPPLSTWIPLARIQGHGCSHCKAVC